MSHIKMRALALLYSYSPFGAFLCIFVCSVTLEYNHNTSQLCITGLGNVSHTRMKTLAFILSELFPLDGFRCSFVSAL